MRVCKISKFSVKFIGCFDLEKWSFNDKNNVFLDLTVEAAVGALLVTVEPIIIRTLSVILFIFASGNELRSDTPVPVIKIQIGSLLAAVQLNEPV